MMIELAILTGRSLAELRGLELDELATFVDVVEELGRRG
jgi:hypothetical protein